MITLNDPDLEAMLRAIQQETGEPAEAVMRRALARVLHDRPKPAQRTVPPEEQARRAAVIKRIQQEVAALPVLDPRSPDEIIGYDENGLPT